jgi:putative tryptophan/tyrosine transport system substrate-binding protein
MKRRQLITLIAGTAATWPLRATAQQLTPVIGFLGGGTGLGTNRFIEAFHAGLKETGYVEGQNVAIEYRFAADRIDKVPELVADLIRRRVTVICTNNNVTALAVKKAASEIPLVFVIGLDPVRTGLVSTINRPGGNATGVYFLTTLLAPKRMELMRTLLPRARSIAAFVNPDNPNAEDHVRDLQAAAGTFALQLVVIKIREAEQLEPAFASLGQQNIDAALVISDSLFQGNRPRLVGLAALNRIPTMYPWRDFAVDGGLLSYGDSLNGAGRQIGVYAGRILKGEKAGDLPVWMPTKFEFVLNLKTAKALGLEMPASLLAFADEIIE